METPLARLLALALAGISGVALLACQGQTLDTSRPDSARAVGVTVASDPALLQQDDGQWAMPAKNYASTRFSGLDEINAQNVGRLGVSWTFSTGMVAGHEAAPLVVGSTMFIVTPFPNIVYAFDLSQPGAPMRWQYDPKPLGAAKGVACCDLVNRGAAYADGTLFFNTLDGRTIALDADTGRPKWITQLGDINKGETMTMAPLVVKGKVLVGNSGGEFGVRGWLVALDAATGAVTWRAYSTGPDRDVLIGPNFKPFYEGDRGKDLGITTWPGEGWRTGGGTVWGWISYDPALDLIFYGASNPGPWNPEQRPGDNKWTTAMFARRPDTGEAIWAYQTSPHDLFDHDGVNELVLADVTLGNRVRPIAMRADRNGLLYVMDRASGEVLSAAPFGYVNSNRGVDMKTGRLIPVEEKMPRQGVVVRDICPAAPGMKLQSWTRRIPRRGHRVGPGRGKGGLGGEGGVPCLERNGGDGGRRGVLRDDGRLVQGGPREDRRVAVALQVRLRDHRPADRLQRPGWAPVCGGALRRWRLGRRDRQQRPGYA
jgi:PQQ-dependent dehydrogenase (methanol/ethanol family)